MAPRKHLRCYRRIFVNSSRLLPLTSFSVAFSPNAPSGGGVVTIGFSLPSEGMSGEPVVSRECTSVGTSFVLLCGLKNRHHKPNTRASSPLATHTLSTYIQKAETKNEDELSIQVCVVE